MRPGLDVSPQVATDDPANEGLGNLEPLGKVNLGELRCQTTYLSDDVLGEFGVGVSASVTGRLQTIDPRMTNVLTPTDFLQVAPPVISLDAVDVIGLFIRGEGSGEGGEYHSMNQESLRPTIPPTRERDGEIAILALAWPQNPLGETHTAMRIRGNAAHAAKVGDFIPTLKLTDGTPLFEGCSRLGLHRKGRSFRCHAAGRSTPSRLPSIVQVCRLQSNEEVYHAT